MGREAFLVGALIGGALLLGAEYAMIIAELKACHIEIEGARQVLQHWEALQW